MDTKKDDSIVKCDTMAEIRQENLIVGVKQLKKALRAGRIRSAYLAVDADPALTEPIAELCTAHDIPFAWVKTMAELGRVCGIEVGAAAAATVNSL